MCCDALMFSAQIDIYALALKAVGRIWREQTVILTKRGRLTNEDNKLIDG